MVADYASTGVTVGPTHGALPATTSKDGDCSGELSLAASPWGETRIDGCVIARQHPGTAHTVIFLSIENETGISNDILDPDIYESRRSLVTYAKFLFIEGTLQNVDKVIHIRAKYIEELTVTAAPM